MNIILIGYRGAGKSAVGQLLAEHLGLPYISMDAAIVARAGKSVPEIVESYGWSGFRDRESQEARELASRDNIIIDTGGGVIERPENVEVLQKNGCIFWLKASVATIVARIQEDTQRPALTEGKTFTEEVTEVLERRALLYKAAAHHEIETDYLSPEQIADRIIETWHASNRSG